jgi:hypothetical protein
MTILPLLTRFIVLSTVCCADLSSLSVPDVVKMLMLICSSIRNNLANLYCGLCAYFWLFENINCTVRCGYILSGFGLHLVPKYRNDSNTTMLCLK